MKKVKSHLFLSVFLLLSSFLLAQNPHPFFRNYSIDEGLPSAEVHYCIQDDAGFMWFATDNGVSRFDGYGFSNFGLVDGLTDLVALHLQVDSQGRVWVVTLNGKLFYFSNNRFHEYSENEVIKKYMKHSGVICEFKIDEADTKILKVYPTGILKIADNGQSEIITAQKDEVIHFAYQANDDWFLGITYNANFKKNQNYKEGDEKHYEYLPFEINVPNKEVKYIKGPSRKTGFNSSNSWMMETKAGNLLVNIFPYEYKLVRNEMVIAKKVDYATTRKSVWQHSNGSIYAGLQRNGGLRKYNSEKDWQAEQYESYLNGKSVNHLFFDQQGSLWIATLEHGVFECPNPFGKIYDQTAGLAIDNVATIENGTKGELFIGLRNGRIYRLNTDTDELNELPPLPWEKIVYALKYDVNSNTLWAANGIIHYFENDQWSSKFSDGSNAEIPHCSGKTISLHPQSKQLWTGSIGGFSSLDIEKKRQTFSSYTHNITKRTFVVSASQDGRIWVGQQDGLFEFIENKLVRPHPDVEAFHARIDDIDELSDGTLVLATKGQGLLLWKENQVQQFLETDGLTSNMLENVHVDALDRIWAGTLVGLNLLTPDNQRIYQIEKFTNWHGLPSNQVNEVCSHGNEVWIATAKGLMAWHAPIKSRSIKAPIIQHFIVNGKNAKERESNSLLHKENNISYNFFTLNYGQAGKIPYRYRLNEQHWNYTMERGAIFSVLPPNDYTFEVQSQNENGVWSSSSSHKFEILNPWWLSPWFYFFVGSFFVVTTFIFYRFKTNNLRNEFELKSQVVELEKKALQAQMKPHFIFNCLNSIQYLIMKNETEEAMRYLGRFAQLVRGTLNASINGEVTLQDEIVLLQNYLDLEKLRFKDVLNYSIEVDPTIDKFGISFPPLLLQPYVENAVVHGIEGKEQGGFISIKFVKKDNQILAIIKDNGSGMKKDIALKSMHDSVGMTLTERRLELLHGEEEKSYVKIEDILSKEDRVTGTKVEVIIG